ncbi:hypothetical protein AEA09_09235 [Lysinibacillus contaminans]|uniref:Permease n=1 Tax=Lysinibacillus contaminans TaxID=1293441 RepID=A0ABR5K1B6_9BACI|nr:hypothetical protein [Lysinibacillus contaminans]KOS68707.1 hypothetical protein AEA09_09235 [Lysinibacillus contaminans]
MNKYIRSSVYIILLTNIFIICIAQSFYALMEVDKNLFFVPVVIVSINFILWLSNFRIKFYQHWIFAYIGFFCSIFIFYFIHYINIDISEWNDFPPGEAYWDLFLFVFITSVFQLIVLLTLNLFTYLFYKGASYLFKRKLGSGK